MKELITLIDSNHHLLHNYIFLSMYWNMIRAYSPGIIPSPLTSIMSRNLLLYVMSYFLKLTVPHLSCFSFLINDPGLMTDVRFYDLHKYNYFKNKINKE